MTEEAIKIEEVVRRTGKSANFIRRAIQNGSFPGSYTVNENGVGSYFIPRKAFEDYMTSWNRTVSEEIVEVLIDRYMELVAKNKKAPAVTEAQ